MEAHFITFFSPGTFSPEETTKPIERWDPDLGREMARDITERHGATPFCFYFTTRGRGPEDLDSKKLKESPRYFFNGEIRTLDDVATNEGEDSVLYWNMENNRYDRIFTTTSGWRWSTPLNEDDIVLD